MGRLHRRYQKGCSYKGKVTLCVKKKLENHGFIGKCHVDKTNLRSLMECKNLLLVYKRELVHVKFGKPLGCPTNTERILYIRASLEDYCDSYFTLEKYMVTHEGMINPMPDLSSVPVPSNSILLQPPPLRRLPSRPYKNRRREEGEKGAGDFRKRVSSMKCDICK